MTITDKLTVTCEDNMQMMGRYPDQYFDLAIDDPPYFDGPNKLGYYGKGFSSIGVKRDEYDKIGSWGVPGKNYFDLLKLKSKNQIIWGANYFEFIEKPHKTPRRGEEFGQWLSKHPTGWIVWDKVNGSSSFNDFELAWTSFDRPTIVFPFMWNGMLQGKSATEGHIMQGNKKLNEKRIHPTQKPVALYKWILEQYANTGDKIVDNYFGSGSNGIACHDYGFDLTACEISESYYKKSTKRIKDHTKQLIMF